MTTTNTSKQDDIDRLEQLIQELKDPGVSREFDEQPVERRELAEALEIIKGLLAGRK